ncbi:MAG: hypothetical protein H6974_11005 [Gammaproteobacteria bacterium]|nr:hypothetical protein [Gammaproteobacteria bacterium]
MATWWHADVVDNGIAYIKNNCDAIALIDAYSAGDSYATVVGNSVCSVVVDSSDFTLADNSSFAGSRKISVGAQSGTASADSVATPALHFAYLDTGNSKVLAVSDETSDQVITNGNPVSFPALDPLFTTKQPVVP